MDVRNQQAEPAQAVQHPVPDLWSLREVAGVFHVSRATLMRWREKGLRTVRIGNEQYVFEEHLREHLLSQTSGRATPSE